MSLTLSFDYIKVIQLFPFAMYKAFPCSDYYGNSVAMSDIQELFSIALRRSDLGNPHLDK
ncbi:hypothetical protein M124_4353 [Bacteroides fragilis str. 3988T(B)14]|jgi:hypothetical protein|uniref:Uncharacterized protein n=1 Tax=Bacteroides fragilis str. 3988T(B)14 TaxID=1339315 RepID=A0A015SX94_BACFG|nr:hypothetical protein M124_4353 [Bacteroides fragilis str. 3988T(B)14]EXY81059.1 hypothetical protein M084_1158 [Bacteroides fragilis str. 3988 T1]